MSLPLTPPPSPPSLIHVSSQEVGLCLSATPESLWLLLVLRPAAAAGDALRAAVRYSIFCTHSRDKQAREKERGERVVAVGAGRF